MASADLYARAIIASAVSYGDDPIKACEARGGMAKRCIAPALVGLARATGEPIKHVFQRIGKNTGVIPGARRADEARFHKAQDAAEEAVRYALRTKALAERQEAAPAPVAAPSPTAEPRPAPVAPAAPPKTIAEVRRRQETRQKGRAIPRGATLQNVGNGVQVIRVKPITEAILARARQQIAKGVSIEDFAELFDVDAEALERALGREVAA